MLQNVELRPRATARLVEGHVSMSTCESPQSSLPHSPAIAPGRGLSAKVGQQKG